MNKAGPAKYHKIQGKQDGLELPMRCLSTATLGSASAPRLKTACAEVLLKNPEPE